MKRMYSEEQLDLFVKDVLDENVVGAIAGKDIAPKDISASGKITGNTIVEKMSGYSFITGNVSGISITYAGVCKNGNKLTFVVAGTVSRNESTPYSPSLCAFDIPADVSAKIYTIGSSGTNIDAKEIAYFDLTSFGTTPLKRNVQFYKEQDNPNRLSIQLKVIDSGFVLNKEYFFRYEATFLLSENLAE